MFVQVTPIINYKVVALCRHPYYGHKKGCPNWNKKEGCPPHIKMFDKLYDLTQPIYVIYNEFDLLTHVQNLRTKYPNWSDHQLKCCLYWQPKARKQLSYKIDEFKKQFPNYVVDRCPEAKGIDITSTMKSIGINLEWPIETKTYQIALAGILKIT